MFKLPLAIALGAINEFVTAEGSVSANAFISVVWSLLDANLLVSDDVILCAGAAGAVGALEAIMARAA